MADSKITALTSIGTITDPAVDPLVIVDVSDTSMAASGTTKKVTLNNLLACSPTATLASATITGAANFNGGALAGYLNGSLLFGSSGNTLNLFAQSSGFHVKNNSGTFPLLTLNNSGDFTVQDGAGSGRLVLNSTGLGVGGSPNAKVSCAGFSSANVAPDFQINRSSSGTGIQTGPNLTFADGTANNTVAIQNSQGRFGIWNYGAGAWNERLSVDTSGNVGIGVTPSAGKGCLQLSSGINFPATQVASSDANTLDDYEEGTFTATFNGATTNPTIPLTTTGRYTKIGRQVNVIIAVSGATTGGSGRIQIEGLPFANNSASDVFASVGLNLMGTFTGSPFGIVVPNGTIIYLQSSISSTAYGQVAFNAGVGQSAWVSLTYTV